MELQLGKLHGKNLVNNTVGEEKFGEWAPVSAYTKYIFGVSVNIGRENFGKYCMSGTFGGH